MKKCVSPLSEVLSGEYRSGSDSDGANWFRQLVEEELVTETDYDDGDTIVGVDDSSLLLRAALRWKGLRDSFATICEDRFNNLAWLLSQREPKWQHAIKHILTGAVGGQESFQWNSEDVSQPEPREDLSATISNHTELVKVTTCELKKKISSSLLGNAEGIGQLLQYGRRDCKVGDYIGLLSSLNLFVFVRMTFEPNGRISQVRIFPNLKQVSNMSMLRDRYHDIAMSSTLLKDFLPISIPDAFLFLVRSVDEICRLQHIPLTQPRVWFASVGDSAQVEWEIKNVSIVCHTPRSLLLSADDPFSSSTDSDHPPMKVIVKISESWWLDTERSIHATVDGKVNNLRQLIGSVRILDGPIKYEAIVLKPYGHPLTQLAESDVDRFLHTADSILCNLHQAGVFHRDVKVSTTRLLQLD